MTALYFTGHIVNVAAVLPHVMIFSTLLLTVVGICFAVEPSFRGRSFDEASVTKWLKIKGDYYRNMLSGVLLSIAVVLISLVILVFKFEPYIAFKIVVAPVGSYLFSNMILASLEAFYVTFLFFRQGTSREAV